MIFWLSSIHSFPVVKAPFGFDKVVHTSIFFLLALFCRRAFHFQDRIRWLKDYALFSAFAFVCFYGISDELHQRYVPGRNSDVYDLVFDIFGGLVFVILFWLYQRRPKRAL